MKKSQIFISHSSRDGNEMQFFRSLFDDTNVKPVFMEFERWSRNYNPSWQKSDILAMYNMTFYWIFVFPSSHASYLAFMCD
jgi:hypothetical protein